MDKNQIIKEIISLPRNFYQRGDVSMYGLLEESGYFKTYDQIQPSDIEKVLQTHQEDILEWVNWSENKRAQSGWFFKMTEAGKYKIAYASENKGTQVNEYADMIQACAVFIKMEIEDIRKGS
jgi:hypothetical protein